MKFRKRPVVIEAVQWTEDNKKEVEMFFANDLKPLVFDKGDLVIYTLEGIMRATPGDWIIKGVNGEFYPCKPNIFEKTYEKVDDEDNTK